MTEQTKSSSILVIAIVAILAVIAYYVLTMPDQRTGAEKVGDAISELPNGVGNAARQLEDRTPGERLGDAVKDAGDEIKEGTDR